MGVSVGGQGVWCRGRSAASGTGWLRVSRLVWPWAGLATSQSLRFLMCKREKVMAPSLEGCGNTENKLVKCVPRHWADRDVSDTVHPSFCFGIIIFQYHYNKFCSLWNLFVEHRMRLEEPVCPLPGQATSVPGASEWVAGQGWQFCVTGVGASP